MNTTLKCHQRTFETGREASVSLDVTITVPACNSAPDGEQRRTASSAIIVRVDEIRGRGYRWQRYQMPDWFERLDRIALQLVFGELAAGARGRTPAPIPADRRSGRRSQWQNSAIRNDAQIPSGNRA